MLGRVPSYMFHGVLRSVELDLGLNRLYEVDLQHVCEADRVDDDVCDLCLGGVIGPKALLQIRFLRSEPLKDLKQLSRLRSKSHGEVLGRMELLPVALPRELSKCRLKTLDVTHDSRRWLPEEHGGRPPRIEHFRYDSTSV